MSTAIIETTIQDVIGIQPFQGTERFTLVKPTIRTWLMRQGWKSKQVASLSSEDLKAVYTDFDKAVELALRLGQPALSRDRGSRFAAAPYSPKTSSVINFVRRRRAGTAPIGGEVDDEGGNASGMDEGQIVELIRKHAPSVSEQRLATMVKDAIAATKPVEVIIKVQSGKDVAEVKGAKHPKLALLAKAMSARMTNGFAPNIWLFGPTASGKTHSVEQVAVAMKRKFFAHGAMSMIHELMGYKDANGKYHATPFRLAFEHGGVCLFDECDSWDPAVTLALNGGLANGQVAFPDGMVMRHPNSIFVAAGNTVGAGATIEFVGRNKLDAAFMSRFPIKIEWPRDPEIEKAISQNDAWVARVMAARARALSSGLKVAIDPRHSQAGAALIAAGMTMDEAAELTYLAGLPIEQRRTVEGKF